MRSRGSATAGAVASSGVDVRPALYTLPFIGVCLVFLAGFAQNFLLQPTIPLLVVGLGGDATLVGIIFLIFSIPAVVLRPYIGRLADRLGTRRVLLIGSAGLAVAGPLYLIPNLLSLLVLRVAHGTAWAAFNTGAPSTMANLAPRARRGEASAAFDLMPGLAVLIMPTVALVLYQAGGVAAPLMLAAAMGVLALGLSARLIPTSVGARSNEASSGGGLLEPSAIVPMVFQLLMSSVVSLFVVYPPLFAASLGLPLGDLIAYYPVYGVVFVGSRIIAGRFVDRVPRATVLIVGATLTGIALLVAATATTIAGLTLGGVLYAVANGATTPAATALVIDHAPAGRIGAAMATYTLGFQFGSGLGAALWGVLIDSSGFLLPFLIGAALQFVMLGVVVARRSTLTRPVTT
jgi:MFS family permease